MRFYIILFILIIIIIVFIAINLKHVINITGGSDILTMAWINSQEYTPEETDGFIRTIRKYSHGFSPLSQEKLSDMRAEIDNKWSDEQIIATWHLFATQQSLRAEHRLNSIPKSILSTINHQNLLHFAHKYNVPPLALVKRVLEAQGNTKATVDKWLNNPSTTTDKNTHEMIVLGWENDSENPTTIKILFNKSREYEIEVEEMLRKTGIPFKTQEELVKEQIEIYGRPVITPDFLFLEPVIIIVNHPDGSVTDHIVHWIDVKNYMLLGTSFITKSIKNQAEKYVKEFGEGCLMFNYGFVNSVEIPGTVILSGKQNKDKSNKNELSEDEINKDEISEDEKIIYEALAN
jgi:hypothetical protein